MNISSIIDAINDLESVRDSLKEIASLLEDESFGAVDDIIDHIEELKETIDSAEQKLEGVITND